MQFHSPFGCWEDGAVFDSKLSLSLKGISILKPNLLFHQEPIAAIFNGVGVVLPPSLFEDFVYFDLNPRKFRNRSFLNQSFKAIPVFNEASVSNYCSHGALRSECFDESVNSEETNDLKSRIFRLRLPKRSATNVLQRWTSEGNQVTITELRTISKELRRIQRYKHALEVLLYLFSSFFLQSSVFRC